LTEILEILEEDQEKLEIEVESREGNILQKRKRNRDTKKKQTLFW